MRARGSDVSFYQLAHLMRWLAWRGLGLCFAWARLSIGISRDTQGHLHVALLRAAGWLFGGYHVLHEGSSPRAQARFFLQVLEELMPPWTPAGSPGQADGHLPAMLDVERPKLAEWHVVEFLDEWARITTREIAIYTSAKSWHEIVGRGLKLWARRLKLWVAHYPYDRSDYDADGNWQGQLMDPASVARRSNPPPVDWQAWVPDPWAIATSSSPAPGWDWLQHTGHGRLDGYSKDLDLNVFKGTEAELRALVGLEAGPTPAQRLVLEQVAGAAHFWGVIVCNLLREA